MVKFISQFLVLFLVFFCIYMIYFFIKDRNKKLKKMPSIEMLYLLRAYGIDSNEMGIDHVKRHISLINSFIVTVDILIYFNMNSLLLKLFIMFLATLILIYVMYMLLARYYRKFL